MPTLSELTLGIFGNDPFAALQSELALTEHPQQRTRIRDAAVKRLRAAALLPSAIRAMRPTPTALGALPAVFVYTLQEAAPEPYADGPLVLTRRLTLAVYVVVADVGLPEGADLDDALDAIAYVVEAILCNDRNDRGALSGQASRCSLGSTDIKHEDEGERLVGHLGLAFDVEYQQEFAVPVEDLLEQIDVDYDLAKPPRDGVIEAQDSIRLPRTATLRASIPVVARLTGTTTP